MVITFNMATMPQRIEGAIKTIDSIYEQADIIRLYLNNFDVVPEYFKKDKIVVYQGEDLKSTGKVFWAQNKDEYYFCVDDDLIYPPTYAKDMIKKLNEYNDEIVVSLHGKILKKGKKSSYFRDLTLSLHCLKNVSKDTWVHVIGNGVSCFNTNKVSIDYKKFKYNYMDDIIVSMQLQEQNIGALVMAHKIGYLQYTPPTQGRTLHGIYSNKDTTHTQMVNSINWVIRNKNKNGK
tara:strand:- start:444 stop:1145 length:702 start_codon:yes stop_codon:yes gene_type:complete